MIQNTKLITSPINNTKAKVVILVSVMVAVVHIWEETIKNSVYKRCKPNLHNHVLARCPSRKPPARQQWVNTWYNGSPHRNWSKCHNDPALQLSVSTSKPDHISELIEATRKMTRYFKKLYKNSKSHYVNNDNNHPHKLQSSSHSLDKHTHKTHNNNDWVNEVTDQTQMLKGTKWETEDTKDHHDSNSPNSSFDSSSDS